MLFEWIAHQFKHLFSVLKRTHCDVSFEYLQHVFWWEIKGVICKYTHISWGLLGYGECWDKVLCKVLPCLLSLCLFFTFILKPLSLLLGVRQLKTPQKSFDEEIYLSLLNLLLYGPWRKKIALCCMQITKAHTSLRICTVWPGPLLFANCKV